MRGRGSASSLVFRGDSRWAEEKGVTDGSFRVRPPGAGPGELEAPASNGESDVIGWGWESDVIGWGRESDVIG